MATNLESCFHLSHIACPLLRNASLAGGGSVINVSSISSFCAFPGVTLYSISKGRNDQLTRSLAVEWADDKIRVNCIAPGMIATDMMKDVTPEAMEHELKRISPPPPTKMRSKEVASMVSFLCMPPASYALPARSPVEGQSMDDVDRFAGPSAQN
ncbi:hypothetical protein PR202_gb03278 [Eleusine coracana subsp. coracana]|uniref:Uncharacterized protein n=1 Tax=Eleusine coracana subsp. coracana TaxID=191504 RepID=A0AAV5DZ19_ELECO|nr:hypothetical protein PR202_gb03278 [Eleusine coracana subsp. coracana]